MIEVQEPLDPPRVHLFISRCVSHTHSRELPPCNIFGQLSLVPLRFQRRSREMDRRLQVRMRMTLMALRFPLLALNADRAARLYGVSNMLTETSITPAAAAENLCGHEIPAGDLSAFGAIYLVGEVTRQLLQGLFHVPFADSKDMCVRAGLPSGNCGGLSVEYAWFISWPDDRVA